MSARFRSWLRRPTPAFSMTIVLLVVGLIPLPKGSWSRWIRQNVRSQELNKADRQATSASYYEGLINAGTDSNRGELAESLLGETSNAVSFHDIGVTRYLYADVLQFELRESLKRTAFGEPFTTNAMGLRDREYSPNKPPGTFRIAVLGSSIDMGWGVADHETYENGLEDWLNAHAKRAGSPRRFEVLNFAMAAYSPVHRRESFRRKASKLDVDLVILSATMLDPRLTQIHVLGLLQDRADLTGYEYVSDAAARAGVIADDLRLAADRSLANKSSLKEKIDGQLWPIIDDNLAALAADCRASGTPVLVLLVPRAGESDAPQERGNSVSHYAGLIAGHGLPLIDLTDTFDDEDPNDVSVAPQDDHPNARGHKLLFRALAREIVGHPTLYRQLFDSETSSRHAEPSVRDLE